MDFDIASAYSYSLRTQAHATATMPSTPFTSLSADRSALAAAAGVAPTAPLDAIVDGLLARMSSSEKLSQLSGDCTREEAERIHTDIAAGRGFPRFYSGACPRLGLPPWSFGDGPRGVNVGVGRTCFPCSMARGCSFDRDLERRVGMAIARELRASNCNYSGAVCMNLLRHPGWGRAQETYGEDPFHVGEMALALARGIQSLNVMACAKHFALNSIEESRFYVDVAADERALREVYLPHFRKVVNSPGGAVSLMGAYNKFRGDYCCQSEHLLTTILRDDWGFKGFVTSDWVMGVRDGPAAVAAGCEVEMPLALHCTAPAMLQGIEEGRVSWAQVDEAVRRLLRTRLPFAFDEAAVARQAADVQRARGGSVGSAGSAGSVWWGGALKCPGRGPCMRWEVEVKPEAGAR